MYVDVRFISKNYMVTSKGFVPFRLKLWVNATFMPTQNDEVYANIMYALYLNGVDWPY